MILVALFLAGILFVVVSADALDEDSHTVGILLFLLCLIGIVSKRKKDEEDF